MRLNSVSTYQWGLPTILSIWAIATTSTITGITTDPTITTGHGLELNTRGCLLDSASTGTKTSVVTEIKNIIGTTATANITVAAGTDLEREIETEAMAVTIEVTKAMVENIEVATAAVENIMVTKAAAGTIEVTKTMVEKVMVVEVTVVEVDTKNGSTPCLKML